MAIRTSPLMVVSYSTKENSLFPPHCVLTHYSRVMTQSLQVTQGTIEHSDLCPGTIHGLACRHTSDVMSKHVIPALASRRLATSPMACFSLSTSLLARGKPYPWISSSNSQHRTTTTQSGSFATVSHTMHTSSHVRRPYQLLTLPGCSLIAFFACTDYLTLLFLTAALFLYLNFGLNSLLC
jgi:hypothetical protein